MLVADPDTVSLVEPLYLMLREFLFSPHPPQQEGLLAALNWADSKISRDIREVTCKAEV